MEDWVGNSMGKWVRNSNWVSDRNWVSDSMSDRVTNNSSLDNSRSILRNSLIGDILDDSISIVSILDSLDPAIRKSYSVAARGGVTISGLSLLEVCSTVVIIDTILVSVHCRFSKVWGGIARGSNQGASRRENSLHVGCVGLKSNSPC